MSLFSPFTTSTFDETSQNCTSLPSPPPFLHPVTYSCLEWIRIPAYPPGFHSGMAQNFCLTLYRQGYLIPFLTIPKDLDISSLLYSATILSLTSYIYIGLLTASHRTQCPQLCSRTYLTCFEAKQCYPWTVNSPLYFWFSYVIVEIVCFNRTTAILVWERQS